MASISLALVGCALNVEYREASFTCDEAKPICPGDEICVAGICTSPQDAPPDGGADAAPAIDAMVSVDASAAIDAFSVDAAPPDAGASELVVLAAVADTFVDASSQTQNFGADPQIDADANPNRNGLVRFDLASLPAGTRVETATLRLVVERKLDDGTIAVQPILEAWNESEATWRERTAGVIWQRPGATSGANIVEVVPAEVGVVEIELPAVLVQAWLDLPATNFGLKLDSTSDNGQGAKFTSRDGAVEADRPQLVLTVTGP